LNLAKAAEEAAHVADQQVGGFHGGEVATAVELGPVDDVVAALGVAADGGVGECTVMPPSAIAAE
jgi:hypothetical protein